MPTLHVATHSGTFHADDVMAYAILRMAVDEQTDVHLTRTRDPDVLERADVVFDVGGVHDPDAGRFDHHMRDRPLRECVVPAQDRDGGGMTRAPYSSAGLIWKAYGRMALARNVYGTSYDKGLHARQEEVIDRLWDQIDKTLILDIDLTDNGLRQPDATDLSQVVDSLNPTWLDGHAPERSDKAFLEAAAMMERVLDRAIGRQVAAELAISTVDHALRASSDPRLIVLDRRLPWGAAIHDPRCTGGAAVLFVVQPDADGAWTLNCVPTAPGRFDERYPLPESWAGLRDQALRDVTGVADATFCHPNRFIAGAESLDGILRLAQDALAMAPQQAPVAAMGNTI